MTAINAPTGRNQTRAAIFLLVAMAVVVGGVLAFQYLGGFIPCKLCLKERIPYYVGIPIMALAALSCLFRMPPLLTRLLLLAGGLLMTYSLYLAVYHSGVEWHWWPGPTDCGAVAAPSTGGKGILDALNTFIPPSCDKAAGRFLGLSFAGWNAVASVILAAVAYWATFGKAKA
ncbi:MAG: disulfide bond formation protein B [Rhizobiaceae bacterium]|nr:MAG: disulfide bond formation protein B [Rhizobiaceae bacterium]